MKSALAVPFGAVSADDAMIFSLSVGSFATVNDIVPRIDLVGRGFVSMVTPKPSAEPQSGFPAGARDLQDWIGTQAFLIMPH